MVFNQMPHTVHHNISFKAVVEMVDVTAQLVPRAFRVFSHPALDSRSCVMRASAANAAAAVMVHTPHENRLQDLNERVMHVLVGPLRRFTDGTPLPSAHVPSLRNVRRLWLKALDDDTPQFFNALTLCFLYPSSASVRAVVSAPVMSVVHFVDG
mgnify:CR=1 FL=1